MLPKTPVLMNNDNRRYYGISDGGFSRGMNTDPYTGQGFQVAEGVKRNNGRMVKLPGESLFKDFGDGNRIVDIFEYQKSDGTYQWVCFIDDGTNTKLRAVTSDGTVVTPSGGAGDVAFDSDNCSFIQISLTGYVTSKAVNKLYTWDGTTLTATSDTFTNGIDFLTKEGRRVVYGIDGNINFSRADTNPLTTVSGGTADLVNGNYTPNLSGLAIGAFSGSTGTLIAFNSGFELHNIISLDDGSGLRPDTRDKNFQYRGEGITSKDHFTFGAYYGYAVTRAGIIRIDPQTGRSENLLEEEGKNKSYRIREYFDSFNKTTASIKYDMTEQMVVITMNTNQTGVNDICILYHEPTGDFLIEKRNYDSLALVGQKLYGGSSVDGKVMQVFDRDTFSDGYGNTRRARLILEWDSVNGMDQTVIPIDFLAFFKAHSSSSVRINLYINGDTDNVVASFSNTPDDLVDSSSLVSVLGEYILGTGKSDDESSSDFVSKDGFNLPFKSYCWEIIEESTKDFVLNNVIMEWSQGWEIYKDTSFSNKQFKL